MKKIFLLLFAVIINYNYVYSQTEPVAQPTSIQFFGIKAYGMSFAFTASDATKYLVLRSKSIIAAVPSDNVSYDIGDYIGNAKVLANGNIKSLYKVRDAVLNTEYFFAVFAYNKSGSNYNYKTDNPLLGSESTIGAGPGMYYNNYRIDTDDAIDDLSDLLNNHYHLDYSDYYSKVISNLYQKDTSNGKKYIYCDYSNNVYQFDNGIYNMSNNPNGYNNSTYNREHVTPKSWMPTSSTSSYSKEGSDYHNLFPVKATVNSKRSNHVMGEVANPSWTDNQSKHGNSTFEPKDNIKGDVDRDMFYKIVTYNGLSGSWAFDDLASNGDNQNVDLLKQWHFQDPPSAFEKTRNAYIYSQQNSRNPFVDYPEWVNCIDFKTLTLNGNCPLDTATGTGPNPIVDILDSDIVVFPNPVVHNAFVKLKSNQKILEVRLFNMTGQNIALDYELNQNIANFKVDNLSIGFYVLKVQTDLKTHFKRIQINSL